MTTVRIDIRPRGSDTLRFFMPWMNDFGNTLVVQFILPTYLLTVQYILKYSVTYRQNIGIPFPLILLENLNLWYFHVVSQRMQSKKSLYWIAGNTMQLVCQCQFVWHFFMQRYFTFDVDVVNYVWTFSL